MANCRITNGDIESIDKSTNSVFVTYKATNEGRDIPEGVGYPPGINNVLGNEISIANTTNEISGNLNGLPGTHESQYIFSPEACQIHLQKLNGMRMLGISEEKVQDTQGLDWVDPKDVLLSHNCLHFQPQNPITATHFPLQVFQSAVDRSVDFLLEVPKVIHPVTHVTQKEDWDCGISCVAMCLNDMQRQDLFKNLKTFCHNQANGFGTSTWTIDLCYLFAHYGIKHEMFTISLGVNPELGKEDFYQGIMKRDTRRVIERFQNRERFGISAFERSLTIKDIFYYLSCTGPIIILVNANLMYCQTCSWRIAQLCCIWCHPKYQGHYIVVTGYNVEKKVIYYRNPSLTDRICQITVSDFEEARKSFGTDEDTIVIQLESQSKTKEHAC